MWPQRCGAEAFTGKSTTVWVQGCCAGGRRGLFLGNGEGRAGEEGETLGWTSCT